MFACVSSRVGGRFEARRDDELVFSFASVKFGWRLALWVEAVWQLPRAVPLRVARARQRSGTLWATSATSRCLLALKFGTSPPSVKYEQTRLSQMQRRRLGRVRKRNLRPTQTRFMWTSRFVPDSGESGECPSCISNRRQIYPLIVPSARARRGPQRSVRGRGPRETTNSYYPGHFVPPVGHPPPKGQKGGILINF